MYRTRIALVFAALAVAPLFAETVKAPDPVAGFVVTNEKTGYTLPDDLKPAAFNRAATAYMNLPPEKVTAHPDAARFPGGVPAGAERVSRKLAFSTGIARWQSTGLYVAPGETVTITSDKPLPGGVKLFAIVGAHTDRLRAKAGTPLKRFPLLSRTFELKPGENKVANAFGGGLFIEVRGTAATEPPPYMWQGESRGEPAPDVPATDFSLSFANAVPAPLFRLGTDKPEDWERIRNSPAPWGELAGRKVILHVPAALLRDLADPAPLLEWWDKVIEAEDHLVGWEKRPWSERMVPDLQISAGWMHAGYPFMYHLVSAKESVDLAKLQKSGNWGFFHELGHNHQSKDWTFSGQTEVTVNFFSLYCMETIVGLPRGEGHGSMKNLGKLLDARFAEKPDMGAFAQLAPFVALVRQYGWEPLRSTLASYQTKPNPAGLSEKERRAEFVARYSEYAKADLSDFFAKLGYDITGVATRTKGLPKFDYAAFRAGLK